MKDYKKTSFYSESALVDRLSTGALDSDREVVFLVGAPAAAPDHPGAPGVPGVDGVIELMRSEFVSSVNALREFDEHVLKNDRLRYQRAFEFLIGRRGQDVANRLIRKAVCEARIKGALQIESTKNFASDQLDELCKELEEDTDGWYLPPAIESLAHILVDYRDVFGKTLLTSNFDPLIEVGIQKQNGQFLRTVLHSDGNLRQTVGVGTHIVHLHGYWAGYDTLHTPRQLTQDRPQLRQSLSKLLRSTTVAIIAYGGWDDVFTQTLMELVADDTSYPEVIWAFYESNEDIILQRFDTLLAKLGPGLDRGRVTLFKGIDCHRFLPQLHRALIQTASPTKSKEPTLTTRVIETSGDNKVGTELQITISVPVSPERGTEPDNPPNVDTWVGRREELAILRNSSAPVVVISGIGGQGKSALAAVYLTYSTEEKHEFQFWDWRDCKEEGDRVYTQLVCIIERLSAGSIKPEDIQEYDIRSVIDLLFQSLGQKKAILVFDNIDHYVDLETFQPVADMGYIFESALSKRHQSRFIFTCRPSIKQESTRVLSIELPGLSYDEARELVLRRSGESPPEEAIRRLHAITEGHPLWINVIAIQANRRSGGLQEVLGEITRGKGSLPEKTLRSIWETLSNHQRNVLRTLAELERAEPEDQLAGMLPTFTYNRLNRATKTLKAMNLIVTKGSGEGATTLELHPIIRQFVRTEFPRSDREQVLARILNFFDKMIGRYRALLPKQPSRAILEPWIQKADLQINFGRFEEAVQTIREAASPLLSRGFPEELIRLGKKLLLGINWAEACTSIKNFDAVFRTVINTLIQFGEYGESDRYLSKYEQGIPGKSAQFINYCDLRCYESWYQGKFEEAIHWGEEGERLRKVTQVDTKFSTAHNLALARRDSGRIAEALEHFLGGKSVEQITGTDEVDEDKGAAFYGNIGRCLFFKGDIERALVCYKKSARLLETDTDSDAKLNKGYVRLWVGQAFEKIGKDLNMACCAYRVSLEHWTSISPPRARLAEDAYGKLISKSPQLAKTLDTEPWKAEQKFKAWLEK